jgi:membrane protease YdiL (CAAX protease family)
MNAEQTADGSAREGAGVGLTRPWRPGTVVRLFLGVVASLCAGSVVGGVMGVEHDDRFSQFVISSLALHGSILFFVHVFLFEQGISWKDAFGFRSEGALVAMALAGGVTLLVLPCTWLLSYWSAQALEWVRIEPVQQQAVTSIQSVVEVWPQVYMAGAAVFLIPVAEELLFRGVLYPSFKQSFGRRRALWISAVLFGVVHFNLMTFLPLTVLGLLLAWLYERTGNLLAPIVAHSAFNLANLFLMAMAQFAES